MESPLTLSGTPVVPGVGHGPVVWPAPRPTPDRDAPPIDEADRDGAVETYTDAAETVADRLRDRAALADGVAAEVLAATAGLATDRGLRQAVVERIGQGTPIDVAVADATEQFAEMFMQVGGVMAERVTDLKDLRDRVVAEVQGAPEPGIPMPDDPSVLLADDLAPADTAGLDATRIVALATELGGPTSHTAIIARQLGIPCVVAVAGLEELDPSVRVLVNGFTGEVVVDPDADWADAQAAQAADYAASIADWRGPGRTADGHAVALLANVGDGAAARAAAAAVAEGVGLFRTELCFLGADTEPTVEEQAAIYGEVLAAFPDSKMVVRTLDAGSDKPLKFAGMPDEPNPSLGVRGLRIAVAQPELLEHQLDAIKLAGEQTGTTPWVMAPMVATVDEAAGFAEKVRARGLVPGVMVEIPATALLADAILAEVEFMSLGTNDLTQYIMAADRMAADLADLTDPWQPAVLQLVERTAQAGVRADKQVGVCGEAAADPILACVLVGMGVSTLSAATAALPAVGMRLGQVDLDTCREAAAAALAATSAKGARAAARAVIDAATL
ncbi:MAG TPA: putative PEP-binding protein [Nitriliruptoraceae bacterium]|nr:putative PEP-binding protein [Nitriliruptoraceae bacterium]